jgi:GGDEF domain-containing protein
MGHFEYARLGGEEFAVYPAGVRRDDVEALAGELCRVVREQPTQHPVTISIGLTRVLEDVIDGKPGAYIFCITW